MRSFRIVLVRPACPFALESALPNNFSSYGGGGIKDLIAYADRGKLFFTLGLIYCLYNLFRYYALTIADPGNELITFDHD